MSNDHIPFEEVYDEFVTDNADPDAAPDAAPDASVPEGDDGESTDGSSIEGDETIGSESEDTTPIAPNEGAPRRPKRTWYDGSQTQQRTQAHEGATAAPQAHEGDQVPRPERRPGGPT